MGKKVGNRIYCDEICIISDQLLNPIRGKRNEQFQPNLLCFIKEKIDDYSDKS